MADWLQLTPKLSAHPPNSLPVRGGSVIYRYRFLRLPCAVTWVCDTNGGKPGQSAKSHWGCPNSWDSQSNIRDWNVKKTTLSALKAGAAPLVLGLAFVSSTAFAQDAAAVDCKANSSDAACADEGQIVVTGSILKQTDNKALPVTTLTAATLEERGLNTAAESIQRLVANSGSTIQQGWNTGFNFASGANAPALRGLTVQTTLSVADGLRIAPYPLADDGQRNFVDLNTIPDAIIEKIDVLRDGASSTYGADAIAGVINVVTKKEVKGLYLNGSAGISQRGDAGEKRIDATYGYGDLQDQGFNFYVSAEYQKQDPLFARERGYPFNSSDLQGICNAAGSCMVNHNWNGTTAEDGSFNGLISIPGITLVRPVTTAGAFSGAGRFSYLNPAAGCRDFTLNPNIGSSTTAPLIGACEVDFQNKYIMLQPKIERKGLSARFTANVGDRAQVYAMVNYYNTKTFASFTPLGFNGTPTNPTSGALAYNVIAPVYICPTGVGTRNGVGTGCDATNGVLNPYNPYAANGQTAQLFVRSTRGRTVETDARSLRGVLGIDGNFGDGWNYSASFTASNVRLRRDQSNYFQPQLIMNALARGTFNFLDFNANTDAQWDAIAPRQRTISNSDLWQGTVQISKELIELPGGKLQAAVGGQYRHESIDAPSANPANFDAPYTRYYSINAVGTSGARNVKSAFYEIQAPILEQLEVNASGRYDSYSTGQNAFSPKFSAKFKPIPELTFRGSWSKGFRIPSFNEAFGLPTTGFVTRTVTAANCATPTFQAFCTAHANNTYATGPISLGITSVGNPALAPERSTSINAGVVFEPTRNINLTVDFWRIKIKDLIVGVTDTLTPFNAYYANNGVVNIPGIVVTPSGNVDPAFPNALPHIGTIQASFRNANSQTVSGLDFGANARFNLGDDVSWSSTFDASYMIKYELNDNGTISRYDGSLGPCNNTSCAGVPKWRAAWQNTLKIKNTSLSLTAYYTAGYDNAAVDAGDVIGDCATNAANGNAVQVYVDGTPVQCKAKPTWNADFTISQKVNDNFTIYANVLNVFDIDAPLDTASTYQIFQFNPAWAGPNIMGRYFRVGAKVHF
ncbi:MAG: TonB-dependent receptor plug domain-containing protein [Novosphingobium sp.]